MKYINVILYFAVIFTGLALYIIIPDKKISYEEKRKLAVLPTLTTETYLKGQYTDSIDAYMDDHLPYRKELIMVADFIKYYKGPHFENKTEGKIFVAKKQPKKKTEDPLEVKTPEFLDEFQEQYSGDLLILNGSVYALNGGSSKMSKRFADMVNEYAYKLNGKAKVYTCVAPLSSAFIPAQKYRKYNGLQEKTLQAIHANLRGAVFCDVFGELNAHGNEKLYYGTDHHWSARGAYYGYVAFCKAAGLKPVPMSNMERKVKYGFLGSMYQHTRDESVREHPDTFEYWIPKSTATGLRYDAYNFDRPRSHKLFYHTSSGGNMYSTFIGGDHPLLKFTTGIKNGKKCVVVKNSYGNAFAVYLVSHYQEIYVVDLRYSKHNLIELIEQNDINDLIFAIGMYGAMGNGSIQLMRKLSTQKGGGGPITTVSDSISKPVLPKRDSLTKSGT